MPERLEPPVRYGDEGAGRTAKRGFGRKKSGAYTGDSDHIVRPRKSFALPRRADLFVTGGFDVPFFALTIIILSIGLVMLFSASYPYSYFEYGNSYHYFTRQLMFAVSGVIIMLFVSKLNYKIYKAFAPILFAVTIFLLVLVLFYHTDVSSEAGEDFRRYISVGGLFTFQPSDIAKFTLITTLATYISIYSKKMSTFKYGILIPAAIIAVYCLLIMAENHVSGTIIVGIIGLSLMFAGGSNRKLFIVGVALVAAVVIVVFAFPQILPEYVQEKLRAFTDKDYDPLGARWQTNNSLYAIGSGGFFGVGLGNSKQKYLYVSEPQNDFIFSIVCEELGFVGAVVIILLFAALVVRGFIIALRINDKFAALTVIGITTQLGVQVALNILVVTDSIPNTGISLPFFSYGGTALMMILFEMGVVLGISRRANQKKADIQPVE
ncbi:MAG TPA: putative lipid II flippase FtsW [Candidatus Eubacterium faecavium]|nr:putative lipid II flippase FtsW [Candidatus Eubacterium faecavium]